jgi:hypothetical protein
MINKINKIDYQRIKDVMAQGCFLADLSTYGQFAIKCIGYEFKDEDNAPVYKYQLWDKGYTDVDKLINGGYPVQVFKREREKEIM